MIRSEKVFANGISPNVVPALSSISNVAVFSAINQFVLLSTLNASAHNQKFKRPPKRMFQIGPVSMSSCDGPFRNDRSKIAEVQLLNIWNVVSIAFRINEVNRNLFAKTKFEISASVRRIELIGEKLFNDLNMVHAGSK